MAKLDIKTYPNTILRKKSQPLKGIGKREKELLFDMARAMYASNGIGLAAPQVGLLECLIIADIGNGLLKMVNPKILSKKSTCSLDEGCLSVPEKCVTIKRAEEIRVSYLDENEKEITKTLTGLMARVIQHEIDHCNGKTMFNARHKIEPIRAESKYKRNDRVKVKNNVTGNISIMKYKKVLDELGKNKKWTIVLD